jgi:serine/threonine protein kinase
MSPETTIAHYRITGKLGEGGMGAVYRATDTKLNREVAIKVIPDLFAQDRDRMARFTREAQVLFSLNHPNIAAIYGVEERALVMELVDGPMLSERVALGPLALEEAMPIIEQLIDALEYTHEKGVIHRDRKPADIKITPESRVKVLDFGLAKRLAGETPIADPASSPTLTMRATMAAMIMGMVGYMVVDYKAAGAPFEAGTPRRWGQQQPPDPGRGDPVFEISPDGKRLLTPGDSAPEQPSGGNLHATFPVHWFDQLRRRVPVNE